MTDFDDDGAVIPPCRLCDEPTEVDDSGFRYELCFGHLLEMSEPFERHRADPDEAMQALRDRRAS